MVCQIYSGETEIDRIVADEEFVEAYCLENGFTWRSEERDLNTTHVFHPTADDRIAALESAMLAMMGVSADV